MCIRDRDRQGCLSEKEGIFMRRKGQQFIAVLAAAGLLLSTAACGTTGKETAQTGGGTAEEMCIRDRYSRLLQRYSS